jgi:hypothetical protein
LDSASRTAAGRHASATRRRSVPLPRIRSVGLSSGPGRAAATGGSTAVTIGTGCRRAARLVVRSVLYLADGADATENVAAFAAERDVVLIFVLKKNLPAGGAQAQALAAVLDGWASEHPDPYLGPHWPRTD